MKTPVEVRKVALGWVGRSTTWTVTDDFGEVCYRPFWRPTKDGATRAVRRWEDKNRARGAWQREDS